MDDGRRDALHPGVEILVGRGRDLQIARQIVEDAGDIGGALNVGVAAQSVDAAAGAADVAQQQLQHRGGADDLRAEAVLRPADGVDDGRDLLHVAVLADGREQVGGLQELILRNAGDALDHFRRVARILLLQQLIDAARMFERRCRRPTSGAGSGRLGASGRWRRAAVRLRNSSVDRS